MAPEGERTRTRLGHCVTTEPEHRLRRPDTVEYYDSKTSGLSVRVLPTGKKTFYLVHRSSAPSSAAAERRVVRVKLGRYPEVDLAAARERARTRRAATVDAASAQPSPAVQGSGNGVHRAALQEEEKVVEAGRVLDRCRTAAALERPARGRHQAAGCGAVAQPHRRPTPQRAGLVRPRPRDCVASLPVSNAVYGGTWNGKRYGGWPREQISDWVFPSRTNPARAMANFFGKEDAVMRALAKVDDFDPHDLRRTASTWANATCPSPWVDRLLDHEIGGVAGTYNRHEYVEQKRYVAYAIENKVREALGMKPIAMPPRPLV